MKTLALITSVGPKANLEWFRKTARSVNTVTTEVEWMIAAPHSIADQVREIALAEVNPGISVKVKTMLTANIALARNLLVGETEANYVMQFDADDLLVGVGVDELISKISDNNAAWGAGPLCDFDEKTSPVHRPPRKEMLSFENDIIPVGFFSDTRDKTRSSIPMGSVTVHPGACIIRRMYFLKAGGQDIILGNRWEDYVPLMRINDKLEGVWSSLPVFLYRKNEASITAGDLDDDSIKFYDDYLAEAEKDSKESDLYAPFVIDRDLVL